VWAYKDKKPGKPLAEANVQDGAGISYTYTVLGIAAVGQAV